jgi:hypothetical protein
VVVRPLACWDCGLEYFRGHGYLYLVSVLCCQVEVSATNRSLFQSHPTEKERERERECVCVCLCVCVCMCACVRASLSSSATVISSPTAST